MEEQRKIRIAAPDAEILEKIKGYLNDSTSKHTRQYTIEVVTPMFGGGVKAGIVDKDMPIRATEIRGHLRFWWRMLYGAGLNPKELFDAESWLWANTKKSSAVDVFVKQNPKTAQWRNFKDKSGFNNFSSELYALFSAIQKPCLLREGYCFDLIITSSLSNQKMSEVDKTILTWLTFGGLGARTRRGCGTLKLVSANQPIVAKRSTFPSNIDVYLSEKHSASAMDAWKDVVDIYQNFRQGFRGEKHKKILRNGNIARVPGRSKWPEPDAIRTITECALKPKSDNKLSGNIDSLINTHDHSIPVVGTDFLKAFPRAVLGLPINFHFADGPTKNARAKRDLDPADAELLPNISATKEDEQPLTRMASPIITKPVLINHQWFSMVAILPYDHALAMNACLHYQSNQGEKKKKIIEKQYISGQHFVGGGLCPMGNHSNAIEALIAHITSQKQKENKFAKRETFVAKEETDHA